MFTPGAATLADDPLQSCIESRTVQRRGDAHDAASRTAIAGRWRPRSGPTTRSPSLEGFGEALAVARLLWDNAYLRLTCPEAYKGAPGDHRVARPLQQDRIPEQAVGVDPATARLMEWVMQKWSRVRFFNRYLFGTVAPRIQLDVLPALACAAHVLMRPRRSMDGLLGHVEAGIALQRLVARRECARSAAAAGDDAGDLPVVRAQRHPDLGASLDRRGRAPAGRALPNIWWGGGREDEPFAFFCRIGRSATPRSRSLRKDLDELMTGPR